MKKYIPIQEILEGKHTDKQVDIRGWIYRKRTQKEIIFIILRDSTGIIQTAVKDKKLLKEAQRATVESSVEITGTIKKDKRAPEGYEIQTEKLKIIGLAERFPITKDQSDEFLRDVRHLWVRSRKISEILKVRSEVFKAIRDFYYKKGYYEVQSPSFVTVGCEGGSSLFEVKGFDRKVYLTQSWQLHAEALIYSMEKIFCMAPSFRAEKSRTRRHLAEYWHHEMEAAWMDFDELIKIIEELIIYVAQHVAKTCKKELKKLGRDISELEKLKVPFKKITYKEAVKELGKKYGHDLTDKDEKELVKKLGEKPIFITEFPRKMHAFYMKPKPSDPKLVLSADLLFPKVGEIVGASERIEKAKYLKESLKLFKLKEKDYSWYLDLRKFGSIPHSGYGLGIERFVMWLTGAEHIMDTIPFPRTMTRVHP